MSIKYLVSLSRVSLAVASVLMLMPVAAGAQSCPPPETICGYFHPGSVVTAQCEGAACFDMSFAESIRLVATDDRGDFPWVWNLWTYYDEEVTAVGCDLRPNPGNNGKFKMTITGEYGPRCRVDVSAGDYMYRHHFGANPDTNCLGWVECREFVGN